MLKELLQERNLPPLKGREEMLEILQKEEYGYLPPRPDRISYAAETNIIPNFAAGKALLNKITITVELYGKSFSFPVYSILPTKEGKYPFFLQIGFDHTRYLPFEEILDNGFAIFYLPYHLVTSDDADMTNGLAGILFENGMREETSPGKIAMWAWAAHRVMDYAETLDCLDFSNAIVCGHSRLGKTALVTAAFDERFTYAHSNGSGCSGAGITRGRSGEQIKDICNVFGYWFAPAYYKYIDNEAALPFDQHYLIACIAPRRVYITSAEGDFWADPSSEYLGCVAASEAYEGKGMTGFVCEDRLPVCGDYFHAGNIGYHIRPGVHYFSREDWNACMKFFHEKNPVAEGLLK